MAAKKYPLGIAFSGGGAKAAAHCGALQALKENVQTLQRFKGHHANFIACPALFRDLRLMLIPN